MEGGDELADEFSQRATWQGYIDTMHTYQSTFFFLTSQHMSDPWNALYSSPCYLALLGRDLCPCIECLFLAGKCPVGQFEMAWWPMDGANVCAIACLFGATTDTPYLTRNSSWALVFWTRLDSQDRYQPISPLSQQNNLLFPCGYKSAMGELTANDIPLLYTLIHTSTERSVWI